MILALPGPSVDGSVRTGVVDPARRRTATRPRPLLVSWMP